MNDLDVREIREKAGLTQEELAERMGVSSRTVQNWEAGGVIPGTKKKNLQLLVESRNINSQPDCITGPSPETRKGIIRYWINKNCTGGELVSFNGNYGKYIDISIPEFADCTDAINLYGDSMAPRYRSGQIIILKKWSESFIEYGNTYLVITRNGNCMVKMLRKAENSSEYVSCVSCNPEYDSFDIAKEDILSLYIVKGAIDKSSL